MYIFTQLYLSIRSVGTVIDCVPCDGAFVIFLISKLSNTNNIGSIPSGDCAVCGM